MIKSSEYNEDMRRTRNEFIEKEKNLRGISREETSSGIRIFQCNGLYIPDVYIGPIDMTLQPDFCTYKDDDFSFIYELVDETPNTLKPMIGPDGKEIPEVFYENEKYRYEFSLPKSNYVFILTPAIRGRDEVRTPIKEALNNHLVTIEEVEQKGLSFTKIDKEEELKKQKVEEDNNNQ